MTGNLSLDIVIILIGAVALQSVVEWIVGMILLLHTSFSLLTVYTISFFTSMMSFFLVIWYFQDILWAGMLAIGVVIAGITA